MSKLTLNVISKVIQKDFARFQVLIEKGLCNNFGVVHGGAAHLIYLNLVKEHVETVQGLKNLKISSVELEFLSSFKDGETVEVETKFFIGQFPGFFNTTGKIMNNEGKDLVLCSSLIKEI
jgi:predicted transcriptional regulator with HTH domain